METSSKEQIMKLVGISSIDIRPYSREVYCITTSRHRIIVDKVLTSQCPKQGSEAKDFRMVFQAPKNLEDWSEMSSESIQVEMDNGETLELLPDVYCFVKRNGEEVKVFAKDMQEGDEFLAVL